MGQLLFIIVVLVISALSSSSKKPKTDESLSNSPGLDDIFKEVMAASKAANGNQNSMSSSGTKFQQPRKPAKKSKTSSGGSLVTPSNHSGHNCDDVNYDQLDSLMGKSDSFNLGEPERPYYEPLKKSNFGMTRDDLLKSFIMSEVLQRYDINRIYSRIPSAKTDD